MISYRTIRREYQPRPITWDIFVDRYAYLISPLLTRLFVKTEITPNMVTVLMMVTGVIGAGLFALPLIGCKVCGIMFIHLWYVLDCSDGETARITKQFSKFGKEIDYVAHVVNHPLFNLAFAFTLIGMGRYNIQLILFASIFCISAELVLRNLVSFSLMYELKTNRHILMRNKGGFLGRIFTYSVCFFSVYPNYALLFPLVYFVDLYFGTHIALYYLLIQAALSSLMATWRSYRWVRTIVSVG